jgi:hypothetical protein
VRVVFALVTASSSHHLRFPALSTLCFRNSVAIEPQTSALLHFVRKVAHRLLRDAAGFAARQRIFGRINGCQDFRPFALAFFPQRKRFPYRILGPLKPAGLNGLTDKRFLAGSQTYFHAQEPGSQKS